MKIIDAGHGLSDRKLAEITDVLRDGGLIIWPTDTLYGIACDALNPKAIERLCRLKHINPERTNLSIVCSDIRQAAQYARIDNQIFRLMRDNTPGPFTFLLRAASSLPRAFKGRKTVGIRIPDCGCAIDIVNALGNPLMTTTADSTEDEYTVSPVELSEKYAASVDLLVDDGDRQTEVSTIVDCTGPEAEVIREGAGTLV